MARSRSTVVIVAAGLLSLAATAPGGAQSPSAGAAAPSESVVPSVSPDPAVRAGPAGPVTWSVVTKGKDFDANPAVYSVGQLPDGRLIVVGSVADLVAPPVGAAWVSADGSKWGRLKLKSPKGSSITAVASLGTQTVLTGFGDDGGLTWSSADGSAWSKASPMEGTIYTLIATPTGYAGAGILGGAATAWTSPDGATWTTSTLAPSGRALHVLDMDGTLVVAGATTGADGVSTPTVWVSPDGVTWTASALADPGTWSIPTAATTPAGAVVVVSEPGQEGSISHVFTSPDGGTWSETFTLEPGSIGASGSVGTDALLIGGGSVLRSPDGVIWVSTPEAVFDGWAARDLITLADGRLFVAGDAYIGQTGSAMATFIGEVQPLPSPAGS